MYTPLPPNTGSTKNSEDGSSGVSVVLVMKKMMSYAAILFPRFRLFFEEAFDKYYEEDLHLNKLQLHRLSLGFRDALNTRSKDVDLLNFDTCKTTSEVSSYAAKWLCLSIADTVLTEVYFRKVRMLPPSDVELTMDEDFFMASTLLPGGAMTGFFEDVLKSIVGVSAFLLTTPSQQNLIDVSDRIMEGILSHMDASAEKYKELIASDTPPLERSRSRLQRKSG